jgi:hypothetical protein
VPADRELQQRDLRAVNDDSKRVILARRARFLAAAVAGVAVSACGGESTTEPKPCLEPAFDASTDADADAEPGPCLSAPAPDASPEPCLGARQPDAEAEAEAAPCLDIPAPDAGDAAD